MLHCFTKKSLMVVCARMNDKMFSVYQHVQVMLHFQFRRLPFSNHQTVTSFAMKAK